MSEAPRGGGDNEPNDAPRMYVVHYVNPYQADEGDHGLSPAGPTSKVMNSDYQNL